MNFKDFFKPRPENVDAATGDRMTIAEINRLTGGGKVLPVNFYLYFKTEPAARAAARRVQFDKGLDVSCDRAAKGKDWLALATGAMVAEEAGTPELRTYFEGIAAELGGEYDGWEAGTTPI